MRCLHGANSSLKKQKRGRFMRSLTVLGLLAITLGVGLHSVAADEPAEVKILDLKEWLKAMKSPDKKVRAVSIHQARNLIMYPKDVVPILLYILHDPSPRVRAGALLELSFFGVEPGVIPAMIEALKDQAIPETDDLSRGDSVGSWAARGLAGVRNRHIIAEQQGFNYILKQPAELEKIVDTELQAAVSPLMEHAQRGDANLQMTDCAFEALAKISQHNDKAKELFVPVLIRFLKEKKSSLDLREHAVRAIGVIGPRAEAAMPTMREILRSPVPPGEREFGHYYMLVQTFGKLQQKATPVLPELLAILRDKRQPPEFRWAAARSLGGIGEPSAPVIQALTEAFNENNEELSKATAEALKQLRRWIPR
jgi:HEAT repeat protein